MPWVLTYTYSFAFVRFASSDSVQKAIDELNGRMLHNAVLRVSRTRGHQVGTETDFFEHQVQSSLPQQRTLSIPGIDSDIPPANEYEGLVRGRKMVTYDDL